VGLDVNLDRATLGLYLLKGVEEQVKPWAG
jgi:hypothetical protein